MAESSTLDRLTQQERFIDRAARLQKRDRLCQHPLGRDEPQALTIEPFSQFPRSSMVLIAPVAQGNPCPRIDEDGAKRAHRRRRDRLGAP